MSRTKGAKDLKPRAKSPASTRPKGIVADNNPPLPDGYNVRRVAFMQDILPTEPLKFGDIEEMERRLNRYLQKCVEWDMKVGNQAAYAAIGLTRDQVYDWGTRRASNNPDLALFVKKVQQICAVYREGLMEDGKVNPVTGIFWQKNYDGLRDQSEVVLYPKLETETQEDAVLEAKYVEVIPDED